MNEDDRGLRSAGYGDGRRGVDRHKGDDSNEAEEGRGETV
jgi:hypothetical protein